MYCIPLHYWSNSVAEYQHMFVKVHVLRLERSIYVTSTQRRLKMFSKSEYIHKRQANEQQRQHTGTSVAIIPSPCAHAFLRRVKTARVLLIFEPLASASSSSSKSIYSEHPPVSARKASPDCPPYTLL